MNYEDLVEHEFNIKVSTPMMVRGRLSDGRNFLFTYLHNTAMLGLDTEHSKAVFNCGSRIEVDSELHGWLNRTQYEEVFVTLYDLQNPEEPDKV